MHTTRWFLLLLTACTLMACGGEKTYDNPFDLDEDGDLLKAAYDCNDNDASVGKCFVGDYCSLDTQCSGSDCVEGVCMCANPYFTGAECDQCANANMALPECTNCKPEFVGDNCEQCSKPNAALPECVECQPQFIGDDCDECANPNMALPACTECKPEFIGETCDQCANGWTGSACDVCPENYAGNNCDVCANAWTGDLCDECPAGVSGYNCSNPGTKEHPAESCNAILNAGASTGDGTYWLASDEGSAETAFQAYCDMTTDGGGWTLVMKIEASKTSQYLTEADNLDGLMDIADTVFAKMSDARINMMSAGQLWIVCGGRQTFFRRDLAVDWYSNFGTNKWCKDSPEPFFYSAWRESPDVAWVEEFILNGNCGGMMLGTSKWTVLSGIHHKSGDGSKGCYAPTLDVDEVSSEASEKYSAAQLSEHWNSSGFMLMR